MTDPIIPILRGMAAWDNLLAIWNAQRQPCQRIPARPTVASLSVDFYYEFSRQSTDVLIYFFPSEITNAEHLPSGHLIEPTAA